MKLYQNNTAPNPRRTRIFLAEKGIEIPTVDLDIMTFECQTDEFTAKNPMQRIPVLEFDDGTCLAESIAICRYFEEIQPDPPLFGTDARDKAEVEMWHRRMESEIFITISSVFRHTHPAMAELQVPQVADWAEANRAHLEERLTWLDTVLADRPFVAGERISMADITGVVAIDFMRVLKRKLDDTTPNILRWHKEMAARPSYQA